VCHADVCIPDLSLARLSAELLDEFADLAGPGRPDGVAFGLEAAAGIDGNLASESRPASTTTTADAPSEKGQQSSRWNGSATTGLSSTSSTVVSLPKCALGLRVPFR